MLLGVYMAHAVKPIYAAKGQMLLQCRLRTECGMSIPAYQLMA